MSKETSKTNTSTSSQKPTHKTGSAAQHATKAQKTSSSQKFTLRPPRRIVCIPKETLRIPEQILILCFTTSMHMLPGTTCTSNIPARGRRSSRNARSRLKILNSHMCNQSLGLYGGDVSCVKIFVCENEGLTTELRVLVGLGRSGRLVAFILLQYHVITPAW